MPKPKTPKKLTKPKAATSKNPGGRPPFSPEDVAAWQELYLELLMLGKSEVEINAVEGMPSWPTRYGWKVNDPKFFTRRSIAQAYGAEHSLKRADDILEDTYQRALDEAASPQLVAISDKIAQHARWKASRLSPDYVDRSKSEVSGPGGGPLETKELSPEEYARRIAFGLAKGTQKKA